MIRDAIAKLAEGAPLTRAEAHDALRTIMDGEATPAQIGAFIVALRIRGETPEIIAGCAQAMRERFTPVPAEAGVVIDIVGTGGDRAHTFNISTTAAFVIAGAGLRVAKHGNRSVSSRCGSADVIEALGVNLQASPEIMSRCLREIGIAFLFAPALHPAMRHAIGPRREIGIRTVFNILGPISNPAGARHGVLGVYSPELVPVMAAAALQLGGERMFVVHGRDGLDEITLTGPTLVGEVAAGAVRVYDLSPADVGLSACRREELVGGDVAENAALTRAILDGSERGPKRDVVLLNAAAALISGGAATDWRAGLARAAEALDSGAAAAKLDALIRTTQG